MSAPAFEAMAELAAALHGVSTRAQAAQLGISARDIRIAKRQGFLLEPVPGVLVFNGYPRSWRQDLAVVASARPAALPYISHRASGRLFGLDACVTELLEFSVEDPRRFSPLPQLPVIVHHVASIPKCDIVRIDGLATTGLARTLGDLGRSAPAASPNSEACEHHRAHTLQTSRPEGGCSVITVPAVSTILWVAAGVLMALVLWKSGIGMLRSMTSPLPPPPPAGEMRRVNVRYRCNVCGLEIKMTMAPDEDPPPPRHCLEDMDLVAPVFE